MDLVGAAKGAVRKTKVWDQILMGLELGSPLQKLGSHRLALSQKCKARPGRMSPWAAAWTRQERVRLDAGRPERRPVSWRGHFRLGGTKELAVKFRAYCLYLFLEPSSGSRCSIYTRGR